MQIFARIIYLDCCVNAWLIVQAKQTTHICRVGIILNIVHISLTLYVLKHGIGAGAWGAAIPPLLCCLSRQS